MPPVVISCLFGASRFNIFPAPQKERCFFLTNSQEIMKLAAKRGWTPVMMPLPAEKDPLALSLQSKAVKFLAFLDDPQYQKIIDEIDNSILYFDHKFRVTEADIARIVARAGDASILVRGTPKLKTSIWDEVEEATGQERFTRLMDETRQYIETALQNGASADVRICNTGLIYYANVKASLNLARSVFSACVMQRQPECQIFWALHAQRFKEDIKVIDWEDPAVADILWKDPASKALMVAGLQQRLKSRFKGRPN
jgi:hypothetical protein